MKLLFVALEQPHLEFGNVVWSPRLEKIRSLWRSSTQSTHNHSCVERPYVWANIEEKETTSMCYRRLRGDLIEVFKYTHNIYKFSDSLLELESRTNTRGQSYKLKKQRCNTTLQQHVFTQRIVERWNSLPAEAPSLNAFKNIVDLFMHDYIYSLKEPPTNIRTGNWQSEHW